ncbi:MAG: hypothetical protein ACLSB9_17870 [Hydrogeniiclostridium mannosilyticum]
MDWPRTAAEGGNRWAYRLGKELLKGQNTKQDAAGAVSGSPVLPSKTTPYAQYRWASCTSGKVKFPMRSRLFNRLTGRHSRTNTPGNL